MNEFDSAVCLAEEGEVMVYFVEELERNSRINPATGKPYPEDCTVVILEEDERTDMFCGKDESEVYTVRIATGNKNWEMAVGDFIDYARTENLEAVVCIQKKLLTRVEAVYQGHCCAEKRLRQYEPHFLVHSTTYDLGEKILQDGTLKSWNCLARENELTEDVPIGRSLGDPHYFSDYIMFSQGEVSSEIVVMSKQAGEVIMDDDRQYNTGIRFYLDAGAIAEDGLLLRDGVHIKVRDKLLLDRYLLWWADWKKAGLKEPVSTPRIFTERANATFAKAKGINL